MNITAFRKNGKFFSLLMAGVIILFVCAQILVSDSLKVRETISDNHMQINNFTDLFQTVTHYANPVMNLKKIHLSLQQKSRKAACISALLLFWK